MTETFEKALKNSKDTAPVSLQNDVDLADIENLSSDEGEVLPSKASNEKADEERADVRSESNSSLAKPDEDAGVSKDPVADTLSDKDPSSDESSESESDDDESVSLGGDAADIGASADEDEDATQEPIRSKNESAEEPLPSLPDGFEVGPETPIHEMGVLSKAFDFNLIIQATTSAEQRVLKEGSVLCLEDRTLLGPLCEVFGPLQSPFYRVSFPKDQKEAFDRLKALTGQKVFFVRPEAHWLDTFDLKRTKGTDASNGFDEELPEDEQEFSDDEKEAEFRKRRKLAKKNGDGEKLETMAISKKPQKLAVARSAKNLPGSAGIAYRSRNARQSEKKDNHQTTGGYSASQPQVPLQSVAQAPPAQLGYGYMPTYANPYPQNSYPTPQANVIYPQQAQFSGYPGASGAPYSPQYAANYANQAQLYNANYGQQHSQYPPYGHFAFNPSTYNPVSQQPLYQNQNAAQVAELQRILMQQQQQQQQQYPQQHPQQRQQQHPQQHQQHQPQ